MTQTSKSSRKPKNVENTASCEAQQGDNPPVITSDMRNLYIIKQREQEIKRIWGMEQSAYNLLLQIVYNWDVEGKPSTTFGLANGHAWSLCSMIRWHMKNFVEKGLVVYYGKTNNGKLWAPTSEALKIFGISETFTDVCA